MDFLSSLGRAIVGVWTLDPTMVDWFRTADSQAWIAVTIAALAGISTLLGNSVVLFWNHIRGWRFAMSLLINGVAMVCLLLAQAVVITLIGWLATGHPTSFRTTAIAVMLSTAPLIFGFAELAPYVGPGIARVLQVWSLLALVGIVRAVFEVGYWQGLLIAIVGWLIMQGLSWLLAKPLTWLGNRLWVRLSGQPTLLTAQDILAGHQFMPVELDFDLTIDPQAQS